MKKRNLILILTLGLVAGVASRQTVFAGGPSAGVPGGATVKGTVKFAGTAPKPKPISMAADPSCSKLHASPVMMQEVATDSSGDLQNVIVFVSDGLGDRTFDPPSQPAVIDQKGCMYQPHVL